MFAWTLEQLRRELSRHTQPPSLALPRRLSRPTLLSNANTGRAASLFCFVLLLWDAMLGTCAFLRYGSWHKNNNSNHDRKCCATCCCVSMRFGCSSSRFYVMCNTCSIVNGWLVQFFLSNTLDKILLQLASLCKRKIDNVIICILFMHIDNKYTYIYIHHEFMFYINYINLNYKLVNAIYMYHIIKLVSYK